MYLSVKFHTLSKKGLPKNIMLMLYLNENTFSEIIECTPSTM